MSNGIQNILNQIIQKQLFTINSRIQAEVKSKNLDPWGQVAHGQQNFGTIDLGICNATVNANYNIQNMLGLSSFSINQLEITSTEARGNSGEFVGSISMAASSRGYLSAHIGGTIDAQCGFEHPSAKIQGVANVGGISATATGSIKASTNADGISLNAITLSGISINYEGLEISIDRLGIFNGVSGLLKDAVMELFREQVHGAISSAMTPIIKEEINSVLPISHNLL